MQVKDLELAQILLPKPGDFLFSWIHWNPKQETPNPRKRDKGGKVLKSRKPRVFALREIAFEDPHSMRL